MSARTSTLRSALALALVMTGGCEGLAAPSARMANPVTLQQVLASARPGERIVLAPGQYGDVEFPRKEFSRPIRIDASQARFTSLTIRGVDGLDVSGGAVIGDRMRNFAVLIDTSRHISFVGMRVSGSRIGISVSRSQDIALENNQLDGLRSDGVNVAASQRVQIIGNVCRNFNPILASYDPSGKLIRDGDHPDCIQGWSTAERAPTADITITGNQADGFMQGIFFVRAGQGGFDRLIIRNNRLNLSLFNGIVLSEARDSEVSNNIVRTIPGSRMASAPYHPITTWVKVSGDRNRVCGNQVDQPRFSTDRGPC